MNIYGLGFSIIVFLLRILPFAVTVLLSSGFRCAVKSRRNQIIYGICTDAGLLLNLLAYVLLHKLLRGRWNFLYAVKALWEIDFTYQQLDYLPISLLLCLLFSLFLGQLLRFVFTKAKLIPMHNHIGIGVRTSVFSIVSVTGIATILLFYISFTGTQNLVINEVGSYNHTTVLDDTGLVCDYIELYNNGSLDCEIYGIWLSDDPSNLTKKSVPIGTIPAKGHWLIKLDDNTLSVKKEGSEIITLSDSAGNILDQIETNAVDADHSYSRITDGAASWAQISGTPGLPNRNGTVKLETGPVFSHEAGFYNEAFSLHITADEGCTIYYTLDGSLPTANANVYSQPIHIYNKSSEPNVFRSIQNVRMKWGSYSPDVTPVDKAFVVRAIAISKDGAVSDPVTATYFVGLEEYKQQNIISLVADPDDLWGDNGIYVTGKAYDEWYTNGCIGDAPAANFNMRGREWEIEASFSYFSQELRFDQMIGLRINGASARNNILKRFSLYARNEYSGNRFFAENLIENTPSRRLVLRDGTANAVCQAIARNRDVAIQRYTPVTVFLNGEFWYKTNLMEKYDDNYFQQRYGIDTSNIIVCDKSGITEGVEGDNFFWSDVFGYLNTHDMSSLENYQQLNNILDLQSYIDFMCINIYIDNMDVDDYKNVVAWRSRTPGLSEYADGRWRLALYDLDAMEWDDAGYWGLNTQAEKNTFKLKPRFAGAANQQFIFTQLKQNDLFKQQFVNTFMDLVNNEFAYDNVEQVFRTYNGTAPGTYYSEFFQNRAKYIVPYMAEEFNLSGTPETLTLCTNDPAGGYVQLNTITPDLADGTWTGKYYTDYPVTVTAVARDGYEFAGWAGSVESSESTLEVALKEGGITLNAIFKKTSTP